MSLVAILEEDARNSRHCGVGRAVLSSGYVPQHGQLSPASVELVVNVLRSPNGWITPHSDARRRLSGVNHSSGSSSIHSKNRG
jgi:hypothetical protein